MEISMSKNDLDTQTERMLDAAMDGLTPHQALIKASLADAANVAERAAAKEKNRERALKLLAAIEKSQAKAD
jgi:ABC-type transporter Mla subunit MlaD